MFNDGLLSDADWYGKCVYNNQKFKVGDPTRVNDPSKQSSFMNRNDILVARMSEALARVSKGNVYLVYGQEVGDGGQDNGLGGVYQLPRPIDPNNPNPEQKIPNAWRS